MGESSSLIVFPEGTRSLDGTVGRFKKGPFLVAIDAGLPVVPVSVAGSRHVMKKGRLMVAGRGRADGPCADANRRPAAHGVQRFAGRVRGIVVADTR